MFDKVTQSAPIKLGCDVVHGDAILRYEISYGKKAIERESLAILAATQEILIDRRSSGAVRGRLIAERRQ